MSAVMVIYHEPFPAGYLLALAPDTAAMAETELATHLAQACRSGKPAVWVDCRLLDTLSPTAAWLLWTGQQYLRRNRAHLVLCRVSESVENALRRALASQHASLRIVPTLDDAAALA